MRPFRGSAGLKPLVAFCFIAALSWGAESISAQTAIKEDLYNEVVFLRGLELGAGGRALALGGAYRALSDDLSALYWNPAGLASVRRIEATLGVSQALTLDETQVGIYTASDRLSRTRLNEVGLVFPIPTYRGSLVFALGYHQVHGYDSFGTFRTEGADFTFQGDELETGRLGIWSLGMAIDLSPVVSAGLALRLWKGYNDYSWYADTTYSNLNWYHYDQSIDMDLSGFNAITGVLLRPSPWLRLGATLETPLKLSVDESYSDLIENSDAGEYDYDSFSAHYDYKISRPFRGGVGAAAMIGPVGVSGDAVLNDWSQISFGDEPSFLGLDRDQANREIARNLKFTVDLHFGVEFWVPNTSARLQAGYAWLPSPFEGDEVISDKHVFNGGISALLDPSLLLQASMSWAGWDRSLGGWGEDLQLTHLLLTLSYRI